MPQIKERYINPFTDFGFKKIFGEEANKDLLIDFLNVLLKEEQGLPKIEEIPERLQERIFRRVFQVAEIANLTREEQNQYQTSVKYYSDLKNSLDLAEERGKEEGIDIVIEIAKLIKKGISKEEIAKHTNLPFDQVAKITAKLSEE